MQLADRKGIVQPRGLPGQRITTADIADLSYLAYQNLTQVHAILHSPLNRLDIDTSRAYVFPPGLRLEEDTALTLTLRAGVAVAFTGSYCTDSGDWGFDPQEGAPFFVFVPEDVSLVFDSGGAEDRTDIVQIRPIRESADEESREVWTGAEFTATDIDTRYAFSAEVAIVEGDEGAAPPTATEGWIKVAEVFVEASATALDQGDVTNAMQSDLWSTAPGSTISPFSEVTPYFEATLSETPRPATMELGIHRFLTARAMRSWEFMQPPVPGWNRIVWSPELRIFCACGTAGANEGTSFGLIATSEDGIQWTLRDTPYSGRITSLEWSSELRMFVCISSFGGIRRILHSFDGASWFLSEDLGTTLDWSDVVWSPQLGIFCAVSGSYSMISSDGISWQRIDIPGFFARSVAWSPELGIFCATLASVGGSRTAVSPNGVSWTFHGSATKVWSSIAWSPKLMLFCTVAESTPLGGSTARASISPNGVDWTDRTTEMATTPDFVEWSTVIWVPELEIFCAAGRLGNPYRIMTSRTGTTWAFHRPLPVPAPSWSCLAWSGELGRFCVLSGSDFAASGAVTA